MESISTVKWRPLHFKGNGEDPDPKNTFVPKLKLSLHTKHEPLDVRRFKHRTVHSWRYRFPIRKKERKQSVIGVLPLPLVHGDTDHTDTTLNSHSFSHSLCSLLSKGKLEQLELNNPKSIYISLPFVTDKKNKKKRTDYNFWVFFEWFSLAL